VLISLDTLRADRLGMYGAHRPTTPTLDGLAAESTLFETVIAPAPWTLPSHTSMMTGLHECVHGMTGTIGKPFPPGLVPLALRLRRAGYATAAVTEDGFVDATSFTRGFGYYWEHQSGADRVPGTVAHALDWLHTHASEPFFLFVHTYQTHDPYFAPPPFAEMFAGDDADGVPNANPRDLAKYDASVRYTDAIIARLLAEFRSTPLGDRTLLVVTSDHGEGLGERGYTGHGRSLHEEVLRVPLLMRSPGLVAAGRRVPGLVGVIDVTPTILDLVGLPVPPGITGISLAPQARADASPSAAPERALFAENTLEHYRLAIRWPQWKATWDGGPDGVINDLARSPSEREADGSGARAAAATAMRAAFEAECERERADLAAAGASLHVQAPALPDPERERQLKALGYLE
jgi:arylsulfatase A-like enzyme